MKPSKKKNILFVDDEPLVFQGLKRMLRPMRNEWSLSFALNGNDAIDYIHNHPVDVVITDLKIPGMDGVQLLNEVKKSHPQTVRIIMSAHTDRDMVCMTTKLAHQYLPKPCSPDLLKITLNRAFSRTNTTSNQKLQRVISRMQSIPSLPMLYSEIMDELKSNDTRIKNVSSIIARDPGMTAKILQMVNSAFFGLPQRISKPETAVSLLGLNLVKTLVLSIGVLSRFNHLKLPDFSIEKLLEHSLATGSCAKEILRYEKADKNQMNDAFTAGLLHDVGKLVLAENFPFEYQNILDMVKQDKKSVYEAEKEVLNVTHAETGAWLLELWGLPQNVVDSVSYHQGPIPSSQVFGPSVAVHIANSFENAESLDCIFDDASTLIDHNCLKALDMTSHLEQWGKIYESILSREEPL